MERPKLVLVKGEHLNLAKEDAEKLSIFLHRVYSYIQTAKQMNLLMQADNAQRWHPDWFRIISQDVGEDLEYLEGSVSSAMDYVDEFRLREPSRP